MLLQPQEPVGAHAFVCMPMWVPIMYQEPESVYERSMTLKLNLEFGMHSFLLWSKGQELDEQFILLYLGFRLIRGVQLI